MDTTRYIAFELGLCANGVIYVRHSSHHKQCKDIYYLPLTYLIFSINIDSEELPKNCYFCLQLLWFLLQFPIPSFITIIFYN